MPERMFYNCMVINEIVFCSTLKSVKPREQKLSLIKLNLWNHAIAVVRIQSKIHQKHRQDSLRRFSTYSNSL